MLAFVLVLSLLLRQILAIPTISAKGAKFFTSDGAQFFIKGVAYQLEEDDTLLDAAQCERDAALMKTLGANSIRVYHAETDKDHDGCMSAFEDAGIYVWIDLDNGDDYILPDDSNVPRWTKTQLQKYQAQMDAFQGYDNLAGFFVGNEMLTTGADSIAAPYIKSAARDLKAYRDKQGYRPIPIGYSAADIPDLRPNLQNYLACGSDSSENVDFYSLNAYEWCGDSSYEISGYENLEKNATGYDIPIFFSETGCNVPEPRTFDDQSAIFGPEMVDTWSGAIIYQWIEVINNYGLIEYGPASGGAAGYPRSGNPTPIQPDFDNLKSQWATLNPSGVAEAAYKPSLTPPPCPPYTKGMWEVKGDVPLPTLGESAKPIKEPATPSPTAGKNGNSGSGGEKGTVGEASASASATSSANSASSMSRSKSGGFGAIEMVFKDWSLHIHASFWLVGVAVAIAL